MKLCQILSLVLTFTISVVQCLTADELAKEAASSNNVIKVTDKNYQKIFNNREDYNVLLFVTASSVRVGCVLCTELVPVINTISSSYVQNLEKFTPSLDDEDKKNERVFFAVADFADNKKFFGELGLQTVPKLFLYKSNAHKKASVAQNINDYEEYSFLQGDHTNEIVRFLIEATKTPAKLFEIHEPTDYGKIFTRFSFLFLLVIVIYKTYYKFDKVVKSTFVYNFLSLFAIISFTAGFMYNQIRQTPYSREQQGQLVYFASGHQQQLGAETHLVSIVYFGLFLAMWFLITKVSAIGNAQLKLIAVVVLNVAIFVLYSLIINFYHIKNGGYPFYLTQFL